MATRTIANGGGNWNSTSTWVEGAIAVAGDAVVATPTSGQLTVNTSSACASIILTGYANTLTFNATLTVTSTVTFVSGMTIAGTGGKLTCNGTATLTSAGKTLTCNLDLNGANTYTLADDWTVNGNVSISNGSTATVVNGSNLNCKANLASASSSATAVTGTTQVNLTGTGTWSNSSTGVFGLNLTINTAGTITLSGTLVYGVNTLTYTAGTLSLGTSILKIANSCTLTWGSQNLANLSFSAAAALTCTNDLNVTDTLTVSGTANISFLGASMTVTNVVTTGVTGTRTITFTSGKTLSISGDITLVGTATAHPSFVASIGGSVFYLTLAAGATQTVAYNTPTDCDASRGQQIFNYAGTNTNSLNWYSTFPVVRREPQEMMVG